MYLGVCGNLFASLQMKAEMEKQPTIPTTDGGCKTEFQVLSEVLSKKYSKTRLSSECGTYYSFWIENKDFLLIAYSIACHEKQVAQHGSKNNPKKGFLPLLIFFSLSN